MVTHPSTDPTRADIPKRLVGPVAAIAGAIVLFGILMWMLTTVFVDSGQGIQELLHMF